jgi:hypothetical protein
MADMPRLATMPAAAKSAQPSTMILTKEDILKGAQKRETLRLQGYDKDVVIRPLTDAELTEVFRVFGPVPVDDSGFPRLDRVSVSENLVAMRRIAALGLSEPRLSEEEVGAMQYGVPAQIAHRVLEISGVTPSVGEAAAGFREES